MLVPKRQIMSMWDMGDGGRDVGKKVRKIKAFEESSKMISRQCVTSDAVRKT